MPVDIVILVVICRMMCTAIIVAGAGVPGCLARVHLVKRMDGSIGKVDQRGNNRARAQSVDFSMRRITVQSARSRSRLGDLLLDNHV